MNSQPNSTIGAPVYELNTRLTQLEQDPHTSSTPLVTRLQREQFGWSRPFTERVIQEYKRFLILAAISDRQVTPSEEVDAAWHLHIIYTESYHAWCDTLFGRYLHHGPSKGGAVEGERFRDQYEYTLTLYEQTFGETAPREIWPPATVRFDPARRGVNVARSDYWILRKSPRTVAAVIIAMAALGLGSVLGAMALLEATFPPIHAQSENALREQEAIPAWVPLACVGIVAAFLLVAVIQTAASNRKEHKEGREGGSGCGGATAGGGCGGGSGKGSTGDAGDGGGGDGGSGCGGGGCGGGCGGCGG